MISKKISMLFALLMLMPMGFAASELKCDCIKATVSTEVLATPYVRQDPVFIDQVTLPSHAVVSRSIRFLGTDSQVDSYFRMFDKYAKDNNLKTSQLHIVTKVFDKNVFFYDVREGTVYPDLQPSEELR